MVEINVENTINEYINGTDWRIRANANQGYSYGGVVLNSAGKLMANYWLNEVYSPEACRAHKDGDLHIHDLDMLAPYCAGWSLKTLLNEGFNGVPNRISSEPPSHFSSALSMMVNFFGTLQNEWAGAQAFSGFDTYLAPFVYADKLNYTEVKQIMQQFLFNLNTPSRWGTQTPFTNLTFDLTCPDDLKDTVVKIKNKPVILDVNEIYKEMTYSDFQPEMDMINKVFIELMCQGDAKGRPFTYPIPTYNITEDFEWDSPISNDIFKMTAKYGTPYFQNFINSSMKPSDIRSMCCRLQLDLNQLKMRGNGLFGSAEQTGSIGVVTINMPRIGYKNRGMFSLVIDDLNKQLNIAFDTLERKRVKLTELLERGLYPYTTRYLGTFRNHFSTIGIVGMNEFIVNFTEGQFDITTKDGQTLADTLMLHIRGRLKEFQEKSGNMYNLEATPAEGATYRLARCDIAKYPAIFQQGEQPNMFYTNSTQLPVGYTSDLFESLDLQEMLQQRYTGGTVFHAYIGDAGADAAVVKDIVKKVLTNYRIPYFTWTPTFSICPQHGYIAAEHHTCPQCGSVTEVWTRVMGYHRPVSEWNIGKKAEFALRKKYILQGDNNDNKE